MMLLAFLLSLLPLQAAELNGVSIQGIATPNLSAFDELVTSLMQKYKVPGGALAVAKDGRLILAHGYGLADVEKQQPVRPGSLFRIASLSKPITAVTILHLVEQGKLRLNDKVVDVLSLGNPSDARWKRITIQNLLQHTGGWDRAKSFDPMFIPAKAAEAVGDKAPASCQTIIRYMLTQPLQSDPGTAYSYSNFGYCLLGRVIEKVTGKTYEDYVKSEILAPIGITSMRIGQSLLDQRATNEVRYYTPEAAGLAASVFPSHPGKVPWPYGGWHIEAMDSHGGWIASAVDLVRFLVHADGSKAPPILKPSTITQMTGKPSFEKDKESWYGLGWQIVKTSNGSNWFHTGSLDGTTTLMVRTSTGMHWALLFNYRARGSKLPTDMDSGVWKALEQVKRWPERDLFDRFE